MGMFWMRAACATSLLALVACGGGGGGGDSRPPQTLKGASYAIPGGSLSQAQLRRTDGGSGANIGDVVFVDDGVFEFLGRRTRQLDSITTEFQDEDGNTAIVTAPPGYEHSRLLRQVFTQGGTTYVSEGVIGRFTSDAEMRLASGEATYVGIGTAQVRGDRGFGSTFDLSGGNAVVEVDFGDGTVNTTLDFGSTASAVNAPIDAVQINGMRISGNRFGGGTLTSTQGGQPRAAYSTPTPSSSGVFAGFNDATGAVRGGNRPAEVGGAFVAELGAATLLGRYVAD
jgi:hypothetical protein